jgi:hypothetical protein
MARTGSTPPPLERRRRIRKRTVSTAQTDSPAQSDTYSYDDPYSAAPQQSAAQQSAPLDPVTTQQS